MIEKKNARLVLLFLATPSFGDHSFVLQVCVIDIK